jgi:hypothetical protein
MSETETEIREGKLRCATCFARAEWLQDGRAACVLHLPTCVAGAFTRDELLVLLPFRRAMWNLRRAEEQAGAKMCLGIPDRWYEPPRYRCVRGHVASGVITSESGRGDSCQTCGAACMLTFPEDVGGPLPATVARPSA